jgi:hypothetical protein
MNSRAQMTGSSPTNERKPLQGKPVGRSPDLRYPTSGLFTRRLMIVRFLTKQLGSAKAAHGHGEISINSASSQTLKTGSEPSAAGPPRSKAAIVDRMKVEDIAEAVAKLPPDELARFRRWFSAFEAGHTDHTDELDSTATKLGRFAGRALAELKKRTKDGAP